MNKETFERAFSLFYSPNAHIKYSGGLFDEPWTDRGLVCATDSISLISIEAEGLDFQFEGTERRLKSLDRFLVPFNRNVTFSISPATFDPFRTEDEYISVGGDNECDACLGKGEVEWRFDSYIKDDDCPKCNGHGVYPPVRRKKTGNKLVSREAMVVIGDIAFNMQVFYRLVILSEIVAQPVQLVYYPENEDFCVFVVGDLRVVLMRTRSVAEEVLMLPSK